MIICVCNNISHTTIEQYTSLGVNSLNELQEHISVSNKCRKCETCVVSMLGQNNFVPECEMPQINMNHAMNVQPIHFHYEKELNPINDPFHQENKPEAVPAIIEAVNDDTINNVIIETNYTRKKMKM